MLEAFCNSLTSYQIWECLCPLPTTDQNKLWILSMFEQQFPGDSVVQYIDCSLSFWLHFRTVKKEKNQKPQGYRQAYSLSGNGLLHKSNIIVGGKKKKSHWDTSPLCFWSVGQSERPQRSSVNHITLNHRCWASGARLWTQQQAVWDHSVSLKLLVLVRKYFIGTSRHPLPFLLRNSCYVICLKHVALLSWVVPLIQSGLLRQLARNLHTQI